MENPVLPVLHPIQLARHLRGQEHGHARGSSEGDAERRMHASPDDGRAQGQRRRQGRVAERDRNEPDQISGELAVLAVGREVVVLGPVLAQRVEGSFDDEDDPGQARGQAGENGGDDRGASCQASPVQHAPPEEGDRGSPRDHGSEDDQLRHTCRIGRERRAL